MAQCIGIQKLGVIASASLPARSQTSEEGDNWKERSMPGEALELDIQRGKSAAPLFLAEAGRGGAL